MNLSPAWVEILVRRNFAATHWSQVGAANAPDVEIIAWARTHDHVIFTHDLDFTMILAASRTTKPSVVQLRHPDVHPDRHGDRIAGAITQFKAELEQGALLSIEPDKQRVRLLPLRS